MRLSRCCSGARESEFMSLPPPEAEEVERVLGRILRQLMKDFSGVEAEWEEDDWERVQAEGIQARLGLGLGLGMESGEVELAQGRRRRRVAVLEGFSLHADTWVSGGDRGGLERLLRYAARGPLAGSKLRREEDGRYRARDHGSDAGARAAHPQLPHRDHHPLPRRGRGDVRGPLPRSVSGGPRHRRGATANRTPISATTAHSASPRAQAPIDTAY